MLPHTSHGRGEEMGPFNDGCAERSANRRLLAGADSFQMASHRHWGYWLGMGGLWEAAAGTDGQTQEVEMSFFLQQSPAFLSLQAAASSNYRNNYREWQ